MAAAVFAVTFCAVPAGEAPFRALTATPGAQLSTHVP